jgi:hypothetical protein
MHRLLGKKYVQVKEDAVTQGVLSEELLPFLESAS